MIVSKGEELPAVKWTALRTGVAFLNVEKGGGGTLGAVIYHESSLEFRDRLSRGGGGFPVVAGEAYIITLRGEASFDAVIRLEMGSDPNNDDFAQAEIIDGDLPYSVTWQNYFATAETADPIGAAASQWWRWKVPETGFYALDGPNGTMVYRGDALETLEPLVIYGSVFTTPNFYLQADAGEELTIGTDSPRFLYGLTLSAVDWQPLASAREEAIDLGQSDSITYRSGFAYAATKDDEG